MPVGEEKLEEILFEVGATVFANLAFLLPEETSAVSQEKGAFEKAASISFFGPAIGRLTVTLYGVVAVELAANMLGLTEAADEKIVDDALCEIANVICGNLLPLVAGPKRVFHLHAPQIIDREEVEQELMQPSAQARIGFERGAARLQYYVTKDLT